MSISIAIVGSGPAAFYTADALVKADCHCEVDIIERLPTPYGLIRFGSRTDVLLPKESKVLVKLRQQVRGGKTVVGQLAEVPQDA